MLCLAAWVARAPKSAFRNRIVGGLLLSAAGDALIELDFLAGLVAFLLAHLAYIAAFVSDAARLRAMRALPVAVYSLAFTAFLWPDLGSLRPAFLAYALAISTMIWRAAARVGAHGPATRGEWSALGGAILFALSDSLIALDKFHAPMPGAHVAIMLLYWAGQLAIAASSFARAK